MSDPAHAAPSATAPVRVTMHNTITIKGAHDPAAVGRQVNHVFSEFMQGARASKRLHG